MRHILFICTGNYYRSRFAEAIFNHYATAHDLHWRAFSRGLAIHLVAEGDLSEHTRAGLAMRRIPETHTGEKRVQLAIEDLEKADLVVALDDDEHRPMLAEAFPDWASRITFWRVADILFTDPQDALPAIEAQVRTLLASLHGAEATLAESPES